MYLERFDAATAEWDLDAVGAYIRLLNHQWNHGSIPDEARTILRVTPARARSLRWVVTSKFPLCPDGRRRNLAMEKIRAEHQPKAERRTTKAREAALARWSAVSNAEGNAPGITTSNANGNAFREARSEIGEESTNVLSLTPAALAAIDDAGFAAFWKAYPRKVAKGRALKAWKATRGRRPALADLLAKLEQLKASKQWNEDGGKYRPHPASWLNADGWEDEPENYEQARPTAGATSRVTPTAPAADAERRRERAKVHA